MTVEPDVGAGGVTVYEPVAPVTAWPSENLQEVAQADDGMLQFRLVVWPRSIDDGLAESVGLQELTVTVPVPPVPPPLEQETVLVSPSDFTVTEAVFAPAVV